MALNATMYRFSVEISDLNRHYYQTHTLRVAQHPSETTKRMLMRVLAFALYADDSLSFTTGLCADDEPDLWVKNDVGEIELWIELGTPDMKRVKKAANQSKQVVIVTYGGQRSETWWGKMHSSIGHFDHVSVLDFDDALLEDLAANLERGPHVHCYIEEGSMMLTLEDKVVDFPVVYLQKNVRPY